MSVFHIPKSLQSRKHTGYRYKRYQSFKRVLQHEFSRVCVYCRQPDSVAPALLYAFGVDHYRPKALRRFASLEKDYDNLFYCCNPCNSRKNDYWPIDEKAGPFVLNPCNHDMASHLRFDSTTAKFQAKSASGQFTIDLLQLNDHDDEVQYRLQVLTILDVAGSKLKACEKRRDAAAVKMKAAGVSQNVADQLRVLHGKLCAEIEKLEKVIAAHSGTLPLRPLPKKL